VNETKPIVTMYYREGCHLCDDMAATLQAWQSVLGYHLEYQDIDENIELQQRYHVDIPVVSYNNQVLFYHFFDEQSLRQAFEHGSSKPKYP